jgi:hypothetical protein
MSVHWSLKLSDADIHTVEVTSFDDIGMQEWAKAIGDKLAATYPAHLWAVAWQGGAIVVKNLSISGMYGMVLENPRKMSLKEIEHDAVMKAGELLERCGMKRGKWNGEMADRLEGSEPRFFQPFSKLRY